MPAAGTHGKQKPHIIRGTVTLNGNNYMGARIRIRDFTEGTDPSPVDDYTQVYTNSAGKYVINLAQNTDAYANADSVRVYCQVGNINTFSDVTVGRAGYNTCNFTIVRGSGLADDLRRSPIQTGANAGKGGLNDGLAKGLTDDGIS